MRIKVTPGALRVLVLGTPILASVLMVGCADSSDPATTVQAERPPTPGGVLRLTHESPRSLDPSGVDSVYAETRRAFMQARNGSRLRRMPCVRVRVWLVTTPDTLRLLRSGR